MQHIGLVLKHLFDSFRADFEKQTLVAGRGPFENNCLTELRSGCEAGSYLRLVDFVYHSTLGVRVIKRKRRRGVVPWAQETEPKPPKFVMCTLLLLIVEKPTEGPSWWYPRPVLGAIDPYLEPFCGHLSPKVEEIFQK